MIDYTPFWDTMKRKGIKQYYLIQHGVNQRTLDALRKNRNITLLTLEVLCGLLQCEASDIVRFIPDDPAAP